MYGLNFLRLALLGIGHVLGSIGVFCLYWSYLSAPVAAHAMICLGTATAIALSVERETRFER
jgi:hypothetical protein